MKQQLYGHLSTVTKTIQIRHAGHCWKSKDEIVSNILLWTPTHGHANVGRPAKTYVHQLSADLACSLEDLLGVMNDREKERVKEICAVSPT